MGIKVTIKWEKAVKCVPNHNIISSDFPKYAPQPWKYEEGPPLMPWVMSNEYQRLWIAERDAWQKRMYPDTAIGVDRVKLYIMNFKAKYPPKPKKHLEEKKPGEEKNLKQDKPRKNSTKPLSAEVKQKTAGQEAKEKQEEQGNKPQEQGVRCCRCVC